MVLNFKSTKLQYILSLSSVIFISTLCFVVKEELNYRIVALILLLTVSVLAMLYDIFPVLFSAILSAFIWNYCFIPPIFTLDIANAEDLLMFLSYFFVAMLNGVLTYKIKQAEKKVRDKEEKDKTIVLYNTLFNSLSHELRTPISTILGTVDTLKEFKDKLTKEEQLDLLNDIDIASVRLNRQVENILNMSRLDSGILKSKLDWCDMDELINKVIYKVNSSNTHKIILNIPNDLPLFKLDIGFTEQILLNVIHNAILYTPIHSIIEVHIYHDQNECVINILDNGNGFPKNEIAAVFDKFYRLPHSKAGGIGLGLSIVKSFTEAQNGTVILENRPVKGSKFEIKIPAETTYLNSLKNE